MPSTLAREEVSLSISALSASKHENREELFKAGLGADLPINLVLLITLFLHKDIHLLPQDNNLTWR